MKIYKKDIDNIFEGIEDERTELPQSAKNTIARLTCKETKPRRQFIFKKWMAATASIVLIIPLVIILALQPWATSGESLDTLVNPFSSLNSYYYQNAVATAAIKTMDASKTNFFAAQTSSKTSSVSAISYADEIEADEDKYLKVTYPFTGVRIDSAYEFYVTTAGGVSNFVTMNCGEGTLRVIVANFTLFDEIWPALSDEILLVVIGEKGMVHCLGGGGPYDTQYSMHKYLNGANVEKNTKYEGYGFCVEANYLGGYSLKVIDKDNGTKTYGYIKDSYLAAIGGKLYDIADICLPFIDATVITAPQDYLSTSKKLLVSYYTTDEKGDDIKQPLIIIINGGTEFDGINLNDLAEGKNIRIEFKKDFIVTDTDWMIEAVKIIGLE